MCNKIFEKLAEKQLTTVSPLTKLGNAISYRHFEKIGAIVKFNDGTEGLDMVKVRANTLKGKALYFGVVIPAAAIIGRTLGKH